MKKLIIMCVFFLLVASGADGRTDAPLVDNDVRVNGTFDNPTEWAGAAVLPGPTGDGTLYAQTRYNWLATSSSENSSVQPGWTLQFAWDLYGDNYNVSEDWSYNIFYFGFERDMAGNPDDRLYWVKAWIFDDIDDSDDSDWIGESGLGYSTIDDRGFLIRPMDDMSLEQHWFPGDPEPGDAAWTDATWDQYFGFFGKRGYNNSAYTEDYRDTPTTVNPVFEYVINDIPGNTRHWDQIGDVIEVWPCIYAYEIEHWISDPDRLTGVTWELADFPDLHPTPEPATLCLFGLGGLLLHRRKKA